MSNVTYKIRVNRPCRLFIDDEEMMILEESKLAKINLPEGEYLRKVVAIDNSAIFDEAEIVLSGASKLENIILDTKGLDESKLCALPDGEFTVGDLKYKVNNGGNGVCVCRLANKSLTEVIIPEQIAYGHYIHAVTNIRYHAFGGCSELCSVAIPDSVTSIGGWAFKGCSSLTPITIPNSVTSIGEWAFEGCSSLTSITIPNRVTCIGNGAFDGCSSLNSMFVEKGNTIYDSRDNCNAIIETSTNTLVIGCKKSIIPNSVTSIGHGAFARCYTLTSISIPNSVTSIGNVAFARCSKLTSISIPNSVTSIGHGAFARCLALTSVTIPDSVTSISIGEFITCSSLTSITIPDGVTNIADGAFHGCSSLTMLDYAGTKETWKKIEKGQFWSKDSNIKIIRCTDGKIKL